MTSSHLIASGTFALLTIATPLWAWEPIVSPGGQHTVIHPDGDAAEVLAMREQTHGQFSVITLSSKAGDGPGPAIVHANEAEAWYVLDGAYEFHIGDRMIAGGPGTFIAVAAGQPHGSVAQTNGKLLVFYTPGGYEHFFRDWDQMATVEQTVGIKGLADLGSIEENYGVTRP